MKKITLLTLSALISLSLHASDQAHNHLFISGNTFKTIAHHCFDETTPTRFDPKNVRPYDIIFVKVDFVRTFFEELHPHIQGKYILITHNGDLSPVFSTTQNDVQHKQNLTPYLDDPKLVVWFAQNIDYVHPKLKPIPIGIANPQWGHGNVAMFRNATKDIPALSQRYNKAYLNFIVHSNTKERAAVLDYFKNKPFAHVASFKEPKEYLNEVKNYRFVVSPAGNGLDCHRTWEALLMGCIPIVKHSFLDPLFEGLPVVVVDQWSEVTQSFLDKKFSEIQNTTYNIEKIYAEYWINLIKSYQVYG
jgi:hypothetical protein